MNKRRGLEEFVNAAFTRELHSCSSLYFSDGTVYAFGVGVSKPLGAVRFTLLASLHLLSVEERYFRDMALIAVPAVVLPCTQH